MTTSRIIPAVITTDLNTLVGRLLRAEGRDPHLHEWALAVNSLERNGEVRQGTYSSCPDPKGVAWMLAAGAERIGGRS